jgi:EAL domain-containing protein (putative c-di-GMP-specific phosphodiesterase class I)/ActR/RegA family two-component response regulator
MKRLLVIDDGVEMGALIAAIVKPLGYVCQHATTFVQFKAFCPADADVTDVIVVDLMMPDVDGIEVLRYLGEKRCRAAILLLSQVEMRILAVAEEMARASKLRVLGRLRKPFVRSDLETLLRYGDGEHAMLDVPPSALRPITEAELRRAIGENQFLLHYQPQVDIKSGAAVGVEVLVRWQHPVRGLVYPDTFIGLSESWELVNDLTWVVMDAAFKDLKFFATCGWHPNLAINVSAFSLRDLKLPDLLFVRAAAAGIELSKITVEITESGVITQVAGVLDILARLRLGGVNLSIDDFGTGFSMMRQLKRMPANELKIDKEFIRALEQDSDAEVIVRKTIEIGHELGMRVVAEGVETEAQLHMLGALNCDVAQGNLFSRPALAADIAAWRKGMPSLPG